MATTPRDPRLFPVLLVNFIGMLGYSLVIPILVFLVEKFGGNELIYGILGSIYPAFQLVGAPVLGRLSDDIGRKRVLLISQVGTLLAWGIFILALLLPRTDIMQVDSTLLGSFALSVPLLLLFFARALDGLTGGNVSVANAYLADISSDANRKANFGKMASSSGPVFCRSSRSGAIRASRGPSWAMRTARVAWPVFLGWCWADCYLVGSVQ